MKTILSIVILMMATAAHADVESYKLPVTRDGKTVTRVAYTTWSGEYPGPVIDVNAKKAGFTKITAYKSPRKLNQPVACTIKNGVYHLWSKTKNSVISYYTLTNLVEFMAEKNLVIDNDGTPISINKGSKVTEVFYYGEGFCGAIIDNGKKRVRLATYCDDIYDNASLVRTSTQDDFTEQWLYVRCAEGNKAFVKDQDLLSQKGVKHGQMKSWGEVGPANN